MRKWICAGVIGGLLEFGIIYQVAFSEVDAPPQDVVAAPDNNIQKSTRSTRRAHRAPDGLTGGAAEDPAAPAVATDAASSAAKKTLVIPATSGSQPAGGSPAEEASTKASKDDLLASVLSAASSVVATVAALPLNADPVAAGAPASVEGLDQPAEIVPLPQLPPPPAPVTRSDLAKMPVEDMIREVFGPHGEKAVKVARCESTMRTNAKSGQYLGLFQMGANERADYGHGSDAVTQVLAAHALFLDRGWQPWTCA